jgi:hypothetical protein
MERKARKIVRKLGFAIPKVTMKPFFIGNALKIV